MDRKQKRDAKNRRHRRNERRRELARLLKQSPELCRWLGDRLDETKKQWETWTWQVAAEHTSGAASKYFQKDYCNTYARTILSTHRTRVVFGPP